MSEILTSIEEHIELIALNNYFYLDGTLHNGDKLRPRNWIERLCGVMSIYDTSLKPHQYSALMAPINQNGKEMIKISKELFIKHPYAGIHIINFIKDNKLKAFSLINTH